MAGQHAKGAKKGRKYGRNKAYCDEYKLLGLDRAHRIDRMRRHLRYYPNDHAAKVRLGQV